MEMGSTSGGWSRRMLETSSTLVPEELDFVVGCIGQHLVPRDQKPIISEVECGSAIYVVSVESDYASSIGYAHLWGFHPEESQ